MPKNVSNGYVKKSTPVKNQVVPVDKTFLLGNLLEILILIVKLGGFG